MTNKLFSIKYTRSAQVTFSDRLISLQKLELAIQAKCMLFLFKIYCKGTKENGSKDINNYIGINIWISTKYKSFFGKSEAGFNISYKEIIIPKESKIKTFHYRYPSKNWECFVWTVKICPVHISVWLSWGSFRSLAILSFFFW